MTPVVLIGAGGHAKVVLEAIRAAGLYAPAGFTDIDPACRDLLGLARLGGDEALPRLRADGIAHAIVALGGNALRRRVAEMVRGLGFTLVNAISPAAAVSPSARLGQGIAVMAGAVVNADSDIADLVIVNTRAAVDHDCRIGRAAHLAPGCTLAGGVTVGAEALVGTGAAVIPGVTIGDGAVIGAGAAVVRNIPAGATALGVPARLRR